MNTIGVTADCSVGNRGPMRRVVATVWEQLKVGSRPLYDTLECGHRVCVIGYCSARKRHCAACVWEGRDEEC